MISLRSADSFYWIGFVAPFSDVPRQMGIHDEYGWTQIKLRRYYLRKL